jgi:hypothetical protein
MARDIYAEMQKAATEEEFNNLKQERYEKEQSLKAAGAWDNSWVPTSELLYGVGGYLPAANPGSGDYVLGSGAPAARTAPNPYTQIMGQMTERLRGQKAIQKQAVEDSYSRLAQNAYIEKMKALANTPAALARGGQTGGLAETTLLAPQIAYGSLLDELGRSKTAALSQIDLAADEAALQLASDLAAQAAAQANADRSYNYQLYKDSQSDERYKTGQAYDQAWDAAAAGDFSFLKKMGIDTTAMEEEQKKKNQVLAAKYSAPAGKGSTGSSGSSPSFAQTSDTLYKNAKAMLTNGANTQRVADYLLESAEPDIAAQYMKLLDLFGGEWKSSKAYATLEEVVQSNLSQGKGDTAANLISYWYKLGDITRLEAIRMMVDYALPLSGL